MSNLDPKILKMVGKQMGIPDFSKEEVDLIIKENMYTLLTEGKKSSKDNSDRTNTSAGKQHYKKQASHDEYRQAAGRKK